MFVYMLFCLYHKILSLKESQSSMQLKNIFRKQAVQDWQEQNHSTLPIGSFSSRPQDYRFNLKPSLERSPHVQMKRRLIDPITRRSPTHNVLSQLIVLRINVASFSSPVHVLSIPILLLGRHRERSIGMETAASCRPGQEKKAQRKIVLIRVWPAKVNRRERDSSEISWTVSEQRGLVNRDTASCVRGHGQGNETQSRRV